jgi:hypothetical protein
LAAFENRLLISHDQSTMPDHFAEFISENRSSGLFIAPQTLTDVTQFWFLSLKATNIIA